MPYDIVIRNAAMVDGTGAPRRRTGVAITLSRIAEVGKVSDGARRVMDASDLIVFVDPHTHYDAKICSDPLLTCASWRGVGTIEIQLAQEFSSISDNEYAFLDLLLAGALPGPVLRSGVSQPSPAF